MTDPPRGAPPGAVSSGERRGLAAWLLRPLSRHISVKILAPYLAIILALAALVTYVSIQQVGASLHDRLVNQLLDAGRKANDTMVTLEDNYLAIYRAMAFTQGVDAAVAAKDLAALDKTLQPIQINMRAPYVEVVDAQGGRLYSSFLASPGVARRLEPEQDIANWPLVRRVLARERDALGDKWSAIVPASRGPAFYVAGPILTTNNELVGALLVGMPLPAVMAELNKQALAVISLYDAHGQLAATTLPYRTLTEGAAIAEAQAAELMESEELVFGRRLPIGDREFEELLGRLEVRKTPAFVMGLAYPADYIAETGAASRNQQLALFSLMMVLVLLVGLTLSERITGPLRSLVQASRAVAAGDLTAQAPVTTEDETGELAGAFNAMIAGLRERERVRGAFGGSMGREMADYLTSQGVKLGGEARTVTVMFTDIRGFAGLAEQLTPEQVVALLNGYFAGQVSSIQKFRGRVDKFMGDAILAVFGAPVPYGDHALRAVLAAIDMRESLAAFNRQWTAQGRPPIRFGIGINTGEAVAGNIGASERMEYTVIGEVVNTTQQVENLTKSLGADILLTESTYAAVADYIEVGSPRRVTVRGRAAELAVYPLIRLREEAALPALETAAPRSPVPPPAAGTAPTAGAQPAANRAAPSAAEAAGV